MKKNGWVLPAALAGLGGAVNALLVFLGVPVSLQNSYLTFDWHLIPAGFFHGALLALAPLAALNLSKKIPKKNKIGKWITKTCLIIISPVFIGVMKIGVRSLRISSALKKTVYSLG